MRSNRNPIGWGLFFIVFGVVLLGVRQGWISTDLAGRAWEIWPLLLVAAGLSLILSGRPGAWTGGLVAAVCLGVIAGGLVSTGVGPSLVCRSGEAGTPFAHESGDLPSSASVSIDLNRGELSLRSAPGKTWGIDGQSADGKSPTVERTPNGIAVKPANDNGIFGLTGKCDRLDITLPADPTIDLGVTLNAGEGRLALAGAHLGATDVTVNAGSLRLDLRDVAAIRTLGGSVNAGSTVVFLPNRPLTGDISVNAGSLSICALKGVGLRLTTGDSNPISSNDFKDQGLVHTGNTWETPGFATAEIRIALNVSANAGSMSLNPRQTCSG